MALSSTDTSSTREHSFELEFSIPRFNQSVEQFARDIKQRRSEEVQIKEEEKWVTGIPLFTIMSAICLVCFLRLLDTSIIVTVKATALENDIILSNNIFP